MKVADQKEKPATVTTVVNGRPSLDAIAPPVSKRKCVDNSQLTQPAAPVPAV